VDRLLSEDIAFEEDVRLLTIVVSIIAQGLKIQQMVRDEKFPGDLSDREFRISANLKI
jgi:hypothetical protein